MNRLSRLLAGLVCLVAAPSPQAQEVPPALMRELQPYRIRAFVSFDPGLRLDLTRRERILADWRILAKRFVGPLWELEDQIVTPGDSTGDPARATSTALEGLGGEADKLWLLRIEANGSGAELVGREYDVLTRQLGPTHRRPAPFPDDLPRQLVRLCWDLFAPVAEIVGEPGRQVRLEVKGAALGGTASFGALIGPKDLFRPVYLFLNPEGAIRAVRPVPFTYLWTTKVGATGAEAEVVSALRQPLPRQAAGRFRLVALGVRPAGGSVSMRFVQAGDRSPVAGTPVIVRAYPEGPLRTVGLTGRDGASRVEALPGERLLIVRLMAGGIEPLREVPVSPGDVEGVQELLVEPRAETVEFETRLVAFQDEVVDLIVRRGRLEALMEARAKGSDWDGLAKLLAEYRKLGDARTFETRLTELHDAAKKRQADLKRPVLTRTAQARFDEVEALVKGYLTEDAARSYQEILTSGRAEGEKKADPKKAAPAARPATKPAAAPAAKGEANAPAAKP